VNNLEPDLKMASSFLNILDPEASQFSFLLLRDSGKPKPDQVHNEFQILAEDFVRSNRRGYGVFVTINQTDLKGRKTENILNVRAIWVDLDGAPIDPVWECELKPCLVVESSPGKYHAYWFVQNFPIDKFCDYQKYLISRFDADPQVKDLPRVMRLPGFFHHKSTPFMTRVIGGSRWNQ
jgi:hypothetical protein